MPAGDSLPAEPPDDPFQELRDWLMAPQLLWLRQLGLRPREWEESIDDLEALALGERERAALLREMLAESAAAPAPGPASAGDWLERTRGQGRLPVRAAGELEARRLHLRWSSLQQTLSPLGPERRRSLTWDRFQADLPCRGESLVLVHPARLSTPQRLELWLQLLLAAAAEGGGIRRGLLIARERDRFTVQWQPAAPDAGTARSELERLASLRERWRTSCWPVPPRTGWEWLQAERKQEGSGARKATAVWEGGFAGPGERTRAEMALCFGAELPAGALLDARFAERVRSLYGPVLEAGG